MKRQWKIIIFALLTLTLFVGCQKSNVAKEENITKIEVLNPKKPYRSEDALN